MIADSDTNVVFVADTLERRFPAIYRGLASILGDHGVPLRTIGGTLDVWCREYLPIQVAEGRFVHFRYEPDYFTGKYHRLRADGEIGPRIPCLEGCLRSEVVLDGGNVVGRGNRAIVTDKVFRENPGLSRSGLVVALKRELGLAELIVLPQEPHDPIAHSDGMVCWLGERSVLVNDYSAVGQAFQRRIRRGLRRHEVEMVKLPYVPQPGGHDGMPTAAGNWMNFLRVRDLLIVPIFGMKGDERALGNLTDVHPGHAVEGVDCRGLAEWDHRSYRLGRSQVSRRPPIKVAGRMDGPFRMVTSEDWPDKA